MPELKVPWWKTPITKGILKGLRKGVVAGSKSPIGWAGAALAAGTGGVEIWKALTPEFQSYADAGGRMGQMEWMRSGRPKTPQESGEAITKYAAETEERLKTRPTQEQLEEKEEAELWKELTARQIERTEARWATAIPEEKDMVTLPDGSTGFWQRDEEGNWGFNLLTKGQQGRELFKEWGRDPGENWEFDPNTGKWEFLPPEDYISPQEKWERGQSELARAERQKAEDRKYEYYAQRDAAEQAARRQEMLANLRANPASWLEYASLAGQTPSIQPWMLPLMPQQYTGSTAGQALPGYQTGGEKMNLPGLVTPSAQYMSRISPSARQQYYGYEQARTGATPEDVQWRLWSNSPPGGQYRGLRRIR